MKHGRPPEEIEPLAKQLTGTRRRGETLSLWLERHAHGLQEMVRAGWTWAQLAEALNRAGITYQAGVRVPFGGTSRGAWTVKQLPRAVQKARLRIEAREAARQALLAPESQGSTGHGEAVQAHREEQRQEREPPSEVPLPAPRKVAVFGVEPSGSKGEPDTLERLQAEKVARAQSIIADWKKGR